MTEPKTSPVPPPPLPETPPKPPEVPAVSAAQEKKKAPRKAKPKVSVARVQTIGPNPIHCPTQNIRIHTSPVQVELDAWIRNQIDKNVLTQL